jgi:hypothetical protein
LGGAQTRTVGAFAVHGVRIMASSCTTGQTSGFGIRACALVSKPQLPASYFNEGYPGRNSIGFCSCGIWDIEHLKPQAESQALRSVPGCHNCSLVSARSSVSRTRSSATLAQMPSDLRLVIRR